MRATPAAAAECAGVTLPERVIAAGVPLTLNGLGLREATPLRIDVYVAALYLPRPERNARAILAADGPRQMQLRLLRAVSDVDMKKNIEAGFRRAAGRSFDRHAAALRQLIALVPSLAAGDRFSLTVLPGRGVRVEHGTAVLGSVPGGDFARVLFSIWLGEEPLSAPLKAGLLGGPCGA